VNPEPIGRRDFLAHGVALFSLAWLSPPRSARAPHPQPRPGITAAKVLPASAVGKERAVLEAYAAAREYPALFDGLSCACDCGGAMGHRSLLSCFESRQPTGCRACQEQAATVARLAGKGESLAEIRRALDEEFGG
jgi:hypothetical protein